MPWGLQATQAGLLTNRQHSDQPEAAPLFSHLPIYLLPRDCERLQGSLSLSGVCVLYLLTWKHYGPGQDPEEGTVLKRENLRAKSLSGIYQPSPHIKTQIIRGTVLNGTAETPTSFSEISEPLRQTPGDSIPSSALHLLSPAACYTQGSFRLYFVQVLNLPTGKVSVGGGRGVVCLFWFCFPIE